MANELSDRERRELESMIDTSDLSAVLRALALVCAEKSEHLATAWQDKASAKCWERARRTLMLVSAQAAILDTCP